MNCTHTATDVYENIAKQAGPSPLGARLKAALLGLVPAPAKLPPPRDPVREAADLRTWAASIQQSQPVFAADLFAAADRHESMGS
jgi:hypothetical protein